MTVAITKPITLARNRRGVPKKNTKNGRNLSIIPLRYLSVDKYLIWGREPLNRRCSRREVSL